MLRTHTCNELRKKDVNSKVELCGWNNSRRDHGGVIFVDLRDRYGLTQAVFDPSFNKECHEVAESLSSEDCIRIKGVVKPRKQGMVNENLDTGEIEVFAEEIEILNKSLTPPIEVDDELKANDDIRLKYRYLDLRRPVMQQRLMIRHKAAQAAREFLSSKGFLEIETPLLMKHTPEGARDYVVPSRIHRGKFYSLPQSPQIYKQLLMVAGLDRYYQIPRCLRDEDLRTDRQPEFTQIDVEMSFLEEEDVYKLGDELIKSVFKNAIKCDVKTPFKRISYDEAMEKYGCDKPDLRISLELVDVSKESQACGFSVFENAIKNKGVVKCLNAKGCGEFSRKDIDELTSFASEFGAKGLAWIKMADAPDSSIVKHFDKKALDVIVKKAKGEKGDLLLFVADKKKVVNDSLSQLRIEVGRRTVKVKDGFHFCWVVDFPLFEWDDEKESWSPMHHMFTMPKKEHLEFLERNPEKVYAQCYDLVLNGIELGSGSIRVHRPDIQERIMNVIGYEKKDAEAKFGFLLEAFKYGAPPHGGFALGFDRLSALMCGINDIREVIAFPKTKSAESPMDGSPSVVDESHLAELGLKVEAQEGIVERLLGTLKTNNVKYKFMEHKSVRTSEEAARVRGTKLEQGAKALVYHAGHKYILAVVSAAKEVDEEKLAKIAGVKEIKLASPDEVRKITGCVVGSVPPFGNLFSVESYVDSSLGKNKDIAFNAGSTTKSVVMQYVDYERISGSVRSDFSK